MEYVLGYLAFGGSLFLALALIYIIVMTAKKYQDKLPKPIYYFFYGLGYLGFALDILFRVGYASWITLPPYGKGTSAKDLTFTHQLKEILRLNTEVKKDSFWYKFSIKICKLLEFFDEDHCNLKGILHDHTENKP